MRTRLRSLGLSSTWSRPRRLVGFVVVASFIIAMWGFRTVFLETVAEFLIIDETPETARYVVLLTGEYQERPRAVADLIHGGSAEIVLVCQTRLGRAAQAGLVPDHTSLQVAMLERFGVPMDAIVVLDSDGGVTSTYDEALIVRRYLDENEHTGPLLVATSAFHTRRARWIFRRLLDDRRVHVQFIAVPHRTFEATNWWRSEQGLIYVNNEYAKLAFYVFRYWNGTQVQE